MQRDGTSQAGRVLTALDPDYVSVDERSFRDLLAFAREYAKELVYYDDEDQDVGDWSAFLDPKWNLDDIVAFMEAPEAYSPDKARRYARPHVALFLTFLHLLAHAQDQLNTLTRRHLDFYYQQVLRLTKRPGTPDRVNVLVDLAPRTEQCLLPAGTLLNAGADSLGQDLFYRTDRDIVVNRAQVARLSSVYAEKQITGIRQAREMHAGTKQEAVVYMFQIALGDPSPGDPLPPYETVEPNDYGFLRDLYQLVAFVGSGLFMDLDEFYALMQRKIQRQGPASNREWQEINRLLEKAGKQRTGDPDFRLDPSDGRDFDANLSTALGGPPNFDGITEVEDIYDLYDQRLRSSVQEFIRDSLYFQDINDFFRLMQIKVRIDNDWQEINRTLEDAGQKKRGPGVPYTLPAGADPADFDANLNDAVGPLTYPSPLAGGPIGTLDRYYDHLLDVERYFYIPAKRISYLMSVAEKQDATPQEWDEVYAILADAHKAKAYADRKRDLRKIHRDQGFEAMIASVVGDQAGGSEVTTLDRFLESLQNQDEVDFLRGIGERVEKDEDISDADWERVYGIVERVQRAWLDEPVARKETWLNLHPAEDATANRVELDIAGDAAHPRWKTFGRALPSDDKDDPPPAAFGWAISSPILALSQGQRTITLTAVFEADPFDYVKISSLLGVQGGPFAVEISTEKGWIAPAGVKITAGFVQGGQGYDLITSPGDDPEETPPAIQFELDFQEDVDPIAPLPAEDAQMDSPWPVLRFMLRPTWQAEGEQEATGRYATDYQPFKALVLQRTHIRVDVLGLAPAQMQNDEGALDPSKPFQPFGSSAVAGARLYLGHPELVCKKLDSLDFLVEWMGVPVNLGGHYHNYFEANAGITNQSFTAKISLIDRRLDLPLIQKAPLFRDGDATQPHSIPISDVPAIIEAGRSGYTYERADEIATGDDLLAWNRYLQWELNAPDFQHGAYPALAAAKSVALAVAIADKSRQDPIPASNYQVNPPYTPEIKALSLGYTASVETEMEAYEPGSQIDKLFHIHPFGYCEIQPRANSQQYAFLPQYDHEGELYIGIRDARPPQDLSLLFQMAEGSADPDLEPVAVEWSMLSGDRWLSLDDGNVLLDTTRGLINSGIVTFDLEPALPNTLLPSDLYWIRAAIRENSNSVCDTVAIHSQAVSATFVDRDNAPDHLGQPLPAGSIADLAKPNPQIAAIRQPYTSYGGSMAEQDRTFYTRISERLRHKQRALTAWDYEHMILERFPQIYKVKCLPAEPERPGQVEIVVIPDIVNKLPFDPFEPKAPADLIVDIESYLADYLPPTCTVQVKNAHYVPVKVRFAVRFRPGYNEGFYRQQLNAELNRFLSPWAYEGGAEIVIGGRVYANVLINFIEERPYVDYVAHIRLFKSEDGHTFEPAAVSDGGGYWIETARPGGVLVAARQHEIDTIAETGYEEQNFTGINYMKIELDFIVA
jgi:hypothetical protein